MNVVEVVRRFFTAHRHRLARVTAVLGLLTIVLVVSPTVPRPVKVEVSLGEAHAQLVEVRIAYLQAGEELQGVSFSYPEGAPQRVHHTAELPAGDFEVLAVAKAVDGRRLETSAHVHAPLAGTLHIRLTENAQ